jgi:pimeloyl-ACP methyl ester carboxylesterase
MADFRCRDWTISYDVHGAGDRPLLLIHGLLMNRRMFDRLARDMAERGNQVITIDLLGHGLSDCPPELVNYSMTFFAEEVVALLDYLGIEQAVVGGTSLGANVTLETARIAPHRVKAMMVEMPVLDNAILAVAAIFTPILLVLRFGRPVLNSLAATANRIPRSHHLVDIGLDWLRREPDSSIAVLEGLFLGPAGPNHEERTLMTQPTLVIGHRADPLHPFSDSGMLVEELPNARLVEANSILEWRLMPKRLDEELARFLDEVWAGEVSEEPREAAAPVR